MNYEACMPYIIPTTTALLIWIVIMIAISGRNSKIEDFSID